jgi:hypothetical protein
LSSKKCGERSRDRAKSGKRFFPRPTAAWLGKKENQGINLRNFQALFTSQMGR